MKPLRDLIERFRRGPTDLVGVDIRSSGTPVVRMRKTGQSMTVVAADILPPVAIPKTAAGSQPAIPAISLPHALKAKYVSLALPGENAVVKLLSFPSLADADSEDRIVQSLGLGDPSAYRVAYKLITRGHGKAESRTLAVAMPETDARVGHLLFPSGTPAPFSMEVSELAAMTAFVQSPCARRDGGEAVGTIVFGTDTSALAFFKNGTPSLIRRLALGTTLFLEKIQQALGVDRETAAGIIADGSFDISQSVSEAMDPLLKQLVVSRDFVERREDCHVAKIYVCGELAESHDVVGEMAGGLGLEVGTWNPFESITVHQGALPEKLIGQEWRMASALGACLGTFEET